MITRGYFIGQIIDELTAVSQQVKSRAGLQLYDLNRYLEDFFKDILNLVYGYKLINLNDDRSNNPGLDLGDEGAKVAFQITSTKNSSKVNKTLEKAVGQIVKYPTIYVLILQDKQSSYTGLDQAFALPFSFTEAHILDTGDVLKKVLSLPIDRLQTLHELVSKNVARVKIELEVPDKNGKFQTNIDSYIEQIPRETFEGVVSYHRFQVEQARAESADYGASLEVVTKDFKKFIKNLKSLPRITRQFYCFLLQRSEWKGTEKFINADYLTRICTFPDMDGELRLLQSANLCWWQEPDEHGESAKFFLSTMPKAKNQEFTYEFLNFIENKNVSLEKALVTLDFSDFK